MPQREIARERETHPRRSREPDLRLLAEACVCRVTDGGVVRLYGLLQRVTEAVSAGAAVYGARQTPTLRGRVDGDLRWPVFTSGTQ